MVGFGWPVCIFPYMPFLPVGGFFVLLILQARTPNLSPGPSGGHIAVVSLGTASPGELECQSECQLCFLAHDFGKLQTLSESLFHYP